MEGGAVNTRRPNTAPDQFDEHPYSYPYFGTFGSPALSLNTSPVSSHPPPSIISPPSQRSPSTSSSTSGQTSWFLDDNEDYNKDVNRPSAPTSDSVPASATTPDTATSPTLLHSSDQTPLPTSAPPSASSPSPILAPLANSASSSTTVSIASKPQSQISAPAPAPTPFPISRTVSPLDPLHPSVSTHSLVSSPSFVSAVQSTNENASVVNHDTSTDDRTHHDEKSSPSLSLRKSPSVFGHDSVITSDTSINDSCQFDKDDWFARFDGHLDISDNPPSKEALDSVGDVPVYDAAGNTRAFKSLYTPGDVVGDRQLIIFIRHFWCGACKAYVRALVNTINTQAYFTMPIPTSIIIIGCGQPDLIRQYKAATQCPFPIFADPNRQTFKALGMGITLRMLGPRRPEYLKDISFVRMFNVQAKEMAALPPDRRKMGGSLWQIGGEFLFQNGQVVWCHRMRNARGHAEMGVIRRVLDIE